MRYHFLFFATLLLFSGASVVYGQKQETPGKLARITFVNYFTEDVYLRLLRRGSTEQNIGLMNLDESGNYKRAESLIPPGQKRIYIIPADRYAIILKKDEYGRQNADGNPYDEEFYFPPSMDGYEIHLHPSHRRTTTVSIMTADSAAGNKQLSLTPSFNVYFSDDMIQPIVEQHIELVGEDAASVPDGKTTYTFKDLEAEFAAYKIVPYRRKDGEKAYNQAAQNAPFEPIPYAVRYGITHTVIENTPSSLKIRFSSAKEPPEGVEVILNGKDTTVALNAGNNFTYTTSSPPVIPDVKLLYSLTVDGHEGDYLFTVQRPGDAEFYTVFEQKVLADMNAIAAKFRGYQKSYPGGRLGDVKVFEERKRIISNLYGEFTEYDYPTAHNKDDYKKRVKNNSVFRDIEKLYLDNIPKAGTHLYY